MLRKITQINQKEEAQNRGLLQIY